MQNNIEQKREALRNALIAHIDATLENHDTLTQRYKLEYISNATGLFLKLAANEYIEEPTQ